MPERYPIEKLRKIENRIGPHFFGALYQQRPRARTGGMFQRQWFQIVNAIPAEMRQVRFWDLAATVGGDFTAGCKGGMKDGVYYVADMRRIRGTPAQVEALVRQTAELDGRNVPVYIEQEPGSSGVNTIDHYQRRGASGLHRLWCAQHRKQERASGAGVQRGRGWKRKTAAGNLY